MTYDFPAEWHRQLLARAKQELAASERYLARLKVHGSPYHRAHVIVVEMRRAAYEAMKAIPAPAPSVTEEQQQ